MFRPASGRTCCGMNSSRRPLGLVPSRHRGRRLRWHMKGTTSILPSNAALVQENGKRRWHERMCRSSLIPNVAAYGRAFLSATRMAGFHLRSNLKPVGMKRGWARSVMDPDCSPASGRLCSKFRSASSSILKTVYVEFISMCPACLRWRQTIGCAIRRWKPCNSGGRVTRSVRQSLKLPSDSRHLPGPSGGRGAAGYTKTMAEGYVTRASCRPICRRKRGI